MREIPPLMNQNSLLRSSDIGSSPYGNVPVFLHISHILEPIGSTRAFEKRGGTFEHSALGG